MKNIFRYQLWHLIFLLILVSSLNLISSNNQALLHGVLWGVSTKTWFWIAIAVPIVHQVYVWLIWRLELYKRLFSSLYGMQKAFKVYAIGFSILFVSRLIFIIILALSNQNTLEVNPYYSYFIAILITPIIIYLFYSVKKYFTLERAFGIDHFDINYNKPFEKKGIFRFTNNGMYIYGLMVLYLPGLILLSKAALLVGLFNHVYIWVHYYCTELPDMQQIYKKTP